MDLPSAATDRSEAEPAPRMPSVADYWPDQPGAPQAPRPADEPPQHPDEPPQHPDDPPEAGPRRTLGAAIVLALFMVVGVVLAMFIKQANAPAAPAAPAAAVAVPEPPVASPVPTGTIPLAPAPTATSPAAPSAKAPATAPPKPSATATFEVAATAGSVTVRSQDLGADLYRVTLAKSNGPVTAKVSDSGTNHRLTLVKKSATTAPPITITLDSGIRWSLKLSAGNSETSANLTQSKLAALELAGGARVFDLSLPTATGTLPLRVTHGMNQLKINTNGVPVRTTLRAGAGKVLLDGVTHTDVGRGKVFTSAGWFEATDRVDLDSVEGVGSLTADTD